MSWNSPLYVPFTYGKRLVTNVAVRFQLDCIKNFSVAPGKLFEPDHPPNK